MSNSPSEITLNFEGLDLQELYGENNSKINLLKKAFPDLSLTFRGDQLKILGDKKDAQKLKGKVEVMTRILRDKKKLPIESVVELLNSLNPFDGGGEGKEPFTIVHGRSGQPIKAKTRNQKVMVEACDHNDIVFAVGPAGTGKTYTAVAIAVRALKNRQVKKIILTRPAVEAGESLGFLPGDLKEKVDPYLRPLYDALDDMLPAETLTQFMTNRVIEVAPLAFMRGRTLDHAYIILDEAQNATSMQLKMFLTRLGPSAKCIITGDLSQVDLPYHQRSGLQIAINLLGHLQGVSAVYLDPSDVVRHRLVKDIIHAYDKFEQRRRIKREATSEEAQEPKNEEE